MPKRKKSPKARFRASKYNVSPAEERTVDGITFDSKKEMQRYCVLSAKLARGEVSELELQRKYPILIRGKLVTTYVADFVYLDNEGRQVVEDVKGMKTDVYRLKAKLMFAVYGIQIEEV